jgi:hypothetical protein
MKRELMSIDDPLHDGEVLDLHFARDCFHDQSVSVKKELVGSKSEEDDHC